MSLFDVLRYQVSTPPSVEELVAIPEWVFAEWAGRIFGSGVSPQTAALTLQRVWHEDAFADRSAVIHSMKALRASIRRMPDEPV